MADWADEKAWEVFAALPPSYGAADGENETRVGIIAIALRAARESALEEAAKVARDAINSCRDDGESDLRAARARVEHAIRSLSTGQREG